MLLEERGRDDLPHPVRPHDLREPPVLDSLREEGRIPSGAGMEACAQHVVVLMVRHAVGAPPAPAPGAPAGPAPGDAPGREGEGGAGSGIRRKRGRVHPH